MMMSPLVSLYNALFLVSRLVEYQRMVGGQSLIQSVFEQNHTSWWNCASARHDDRTDYRTTESFQLMVKTKLSLHVSISI